MPADPCRGVCPFTRGLVLSVAVLAAALEAHGGQRTSQASAPEILFAPLTADPKEPHYFVSLLRTRAHSVDRTVTLGSVGLGQDFALWSRSGTSQNWAVSLQAGVMAQFDLDRSSSYALLNTDFVVGLPVAWRRGRQSARLRIYHQSSHLGDEYLLQNPSATPVDVSFEELEGIVARDAADGRGRAYAGSGLLLRRHPDMDRAKLLAGFEWKARPRKHSAGGTSFESNLVAGAEVKLLAELGWKANVRMILGVGLARGRGTRGIRILAEYYHGSYPYGQFFREDVDHLGLGIHIGP